MTVWRRFTLGFQIYFKDLATIVPVVLTIWLPANFLLNYLLLVVLNDPGFLAEFFIGSLLQCLLYPIEIAAVLIILEGRDRGVRVSYGTAIQRALRRWFRVFLTEQITSIFIVLKLFLLIVPGVIAALRYALVDPVTALEGAWPSEAMARSSELTAGNRLQILWTILSFLVAQYILLTILGIPFAIVGWDKKLVGAVFLSCVDSLTFSLLGAFIYLFYAEGKRRIDGPIAQGLPENSTSTPSNT